MQVQKENIREVILVKAREEFQEKGFKDASMRSIAKNAEVSLSNIYNYFRNKDEIFRELLSGLLSALDVLAEEHNSSRYINIDTFSSDEYMHEQIRIFVELVDNFKADFQLLLFKASGSSLQNFREESIEHHTRIGKEYISLMKKKYPEINAEISVFFIHTLSSWWMSTISELVMHDLSHAELEDFISEYLEFSTAGWKKIMKIES
ncbi:transcriptional regulator, TetR family [Mariniphaga anaerophila]|uniref:Transcriptional regulator, TetR family n=1 Tax=Mariniphaga anaerophila TaxID=1484053 RepID=A0A1M5AC20_9BACT|nr:TetR/AcrR family transcriptional regulator [Mariniphaga anaerophila]SHF27799.1 transcriptional regulator, TetR family [Mariniphaga anaerophila]